MPTTFPTGTPSLNTTATRTYDDMKSKLSDFETGYNCFLIFFVSSVVFVTFCGYMDGKRIRKNELFRWPSIVVCGLYSFDFFCDVAFIGQVWLAQEMILFAVSCSFLLISLLLSLKQLNKEIKLWLTDVDTKQILHSWITSYIKSLYFLSILTGSVFSTVELCNSNLFGLDIFYMNLPRRSKQTFKNQRIFSIIILENIPQTIIQYIFSYYSLKKLTFITLISMVSSIASIIVGIFEFSMKQYLFDSESILFVKFIVESTDIQNMTRKQYVKTIEKNRYKVSNEIAKILSVDFKHIELLKPIPSRDGVTLIFHIRNDAAANSNAMQLIEHEITSQRLTISIQNAYKLTNKPSIIRLETKVIGPLAKNTNLKTPSDDIIATISIQTANKTKVTHNDSNNLNNTDSHINTTTGNNNKNAVVGDARPPLPAKMVVSRSTGSNSISTSDSDSDSETSHRSGSSVTNNKSVGELDHDMDMNDKQLHRDKSKENYHFNNYNSLHREEGFPHGELSLPDISKPTILENNNVDILEQVNKYSP